MLSSPPPSPSSPIGCWSPPRLSLTAALVLLQLAAASGCVQATATPTAEDSDLVLDHGEAEQLLENTTSFRPIEDARVEKKYAGSEFGTSSRLLVDGSPVMESYLKFDVTNLGGTVASAKLRLYAFDGSVSGPSVFSTSNNWAERTINWSNKPASSGSALSRVGTVAKNAWIELDVTAAVTGNGTVSFVLKPNSTDGADFYSREGTMPPQLVVTTRSSVDAGTCVPTTCDGQGATCGLIPDGCGGSLDCGSCPSGQTCGGGGTPNVCSGCTPTTCAALGKTCGSVSDGCGGTLSCGTCPSGQSCNAQNVCVSEPAGGSSITVAAVGDILGSATAAKATSDIVLEQGGYSAALILGDLVYPNGRYDCSNCNDFKNEYHPRWGRLNAIAKPTPGNHDYYGDRCDRYPNECLASDANGEGYYRYFRENGVQVDTFDAAKNKRTQGYYSYDMGNWHFVALNTNWSTCARVPCDEASEQVDWLKRDLAANTKKCTLAYWHHPRFSSDSSHGNNTTVAPFWNALYAANADLVLNGHAHGYERFGKQNPSGGADATRGLRQFVVGTGGIGFYSFGTPKPNSEIRIGDDHGILRLVLHADTQFDANGKPYDYEWSFVTTRKDSSGKYIVRDSGRDTCH